MIARHLPNTLTALRLAAVPWLAWLLHQGADIVPIPGTRSVTRLDENAAAATIQLSADTQARLRQILDSITVQGTRYPAQHMGAVNL